MVTYQKEIIWKFDSIETKKENLMNKLCPSCKNHLRIAINWELLSINLCFVLPAIPVDNSFIFVLTSIYKDNLIITRVSSKKYIPSATCRT